MIYRNFILVGLIAAMVVGVSAFISFGRKSAGAVNLAFDSTSEPSSPSILDKSVDVPRENKDSRRLDALIAADIARIAPSLHEGKWINSEPTTLEKLRGQVVLIDFWTYGCYNCRNTVPTLKRFDQSYRSKGLTIVGVHTPESDQEKVFANLRQAIDKLGIKYPVVTDTNGHSWRAFNIEAWPTVVILDKQGRIRYSHIGEGAYEVQEEVIKILLDEGSGEAQNGANDVFNGDKIVKSDAEWRRELTREQFYILRSKGTERAFSGELNDNKEQGDYHCGACKLKLFSSETKFDSGTGWPSFYKSISKSNVTEEVDYSFGSTRTEVLCSRCGSHLGHVFDDGPKPTGLRYCINSLALKFEKRK